MKDPRCLVSEKMRSSHIHLAGFVEIVGISRAAKDDKHGGYAISSRSKQSNSRSLSGSRA